MIAGVIRLIRAHEKVCHLWASSQHWHSISASDTAGIPLCCYAARGLFGRCAAIKEREREQFGHGRVLQFRLAGLPPFHLAVQWRS